MGDNNKKFIILQEDDKGFGIKNRKPSGYTKIEIRDSKFKILYYAQNLDSECQYNLNLILENEGKVEIISIGDIKSDLNGKIDICYDFDESLLDMICGSAICIKDSNGGVKFPLSGFLTKKKIFNWKVNQFRGIKIRPLKKENSFSERRKENVLSKKVEEIKEEICDDVQETKIEEDILEDEVNEEFEEIEEEGILNKDARGGMFLMNMYNKFDLLYDGNKFREEKEDKCENYEEGLKKIIKTSKEIYNEAKEHIEALKKLLQKDDGQIEKMVKSIFPKALNQKRELSSDYDYRFFYNILSEYEEMTSLNFENYVFFKVHIDDFSQMENMKNHDNVKYGVVYYPMMFMYPYFKDKGYFVIGINFDSNNDVHNLVYGIEVLEGEEKKFPYDGKTGFNKYIYDYENLKGYHIMEYDYKNFCVK